ncbi:hypothetical protein BT69DRAFT_1389638 [Atractiella rhizophila]|nr:hypothetical protein BT69DRAFT_1389638 [Atractiella rhizophila]
MSKVGFTIVLPDYVVISYANPDKPDGLINVDQLVKLFMMVVTVQRIMMSMHDLPLLSALMPIYISAHDGEVTRISLLMNTSPTLEAAQWVVKLVKADHTKYLWDSSRDGYRTVSSSQHHFRTIRTSTAENGRIRRITGYMAYSNFITS